MDHVHTLDMQTTLDLSQIAKKRHLMAEGPLLDSQCLHISCNAAGPRFNYMYDFHDMRPPKATESLPRSENLNTNAIGSANNKIQRTT